MKLWGVIFFSAVCAAGFGNGFILMGGTGAVIFALAENHNLVVALKAEPFFSNRDSSRPPKEFRLAAAAGRFPGR